MIGRLKGTIWEKSDDGRIVVNVSGVGYEVNISTNSLLTIGDAGNEVELLIHTLVREDAFILFGFLSEVERALFRLLLTVSGVGGKQALNILNGLTASEIILAIRSSDIKPLLKISGVGKKTAEMIVVSLQDKIAKRPILAGFDAEKAVADVEKRRDAQKFADVKSALANMGFRLNEIDSALATLSAEEIESLGFEELMRKALKFLYKKAR
ncbi:MAG: Holliday junction branch migration protein RuvA [Myxococcota bacterium]